MQDRHVDEKESVHHAEHASIVDSESSDPSFVSPKDNRRVLRKADWKVMPVFCSIVALMFVSDI